MELYYLIYTSVPSRPLDDIELQELLGIAREANSRFQITGMLLSLPESFIQLIEGPPTHIEQLYRNIQKDKRNFRVTTLREGVIDQRFFQDWAMAFKKQHTDGTREDNLTLTDEQVLRLFDIIER